MSNRASLAAALIAATAGCSAQRITSPKGSEAAGPDTTAIAFSREVLPFASSTGTGGSTGTATTPPNLFSVWGSSASDVFVVGARASIFHYDGETWSKETSTATADLHSVWGSAPDQVFACGTGGTILRRTGAGTGAGTGASWIKEAVPVRTTLLAIRGSATSADLYASGNEATILHRNARGVWSKMPVESQENLSGLWVSSGGDQGVAVGNLGTILRLRGDRWNRERVAGLLQALHAVWGPSPDELYIVGLEGTVRRSRGGPWSPIEGAPQVYLRDIYGTSEGDVYMVGWGGTIAHTDGMRVEPYPDLGGGYRLESVWGTTLDPPTETGPDGGVVPHTRFYIAGVSGTLLVGPRRSDLPPRRTR
jgi:hypothetical protein